MKTDANIPSDRLSADPIDVQTWRTLRNALVASLDDRSCVLGEPDAALVTRFFLEYIEERGLRVVPAKPTGKMQTAILSALDEGKRLSVSWVRSKTKQRWRYAAAIDAAPDWRRGYMDEQNARNGDDLPEARTNSETDK